MSHFWGSLQSRTHKSYPLYSPDVIEHVKFQQWEIEDCDPPRPVKFDRLRRINDLAAELGIPNLHSLGARYRAEERWRLLSPLATDLYDGAFTARDPYFPSDEGATPAPQVRPAPASTAPLTLSYVVRISKRIDEEVMRAAACALIDYNEMLQLSAYGSALSAAAPPADVDARVVSVTDISLTETLAGLTGMAQEMSRGLRPSSGDSIRIAIFNGPDSAAMILTAHRAIADSRSVVLFLEDLFRIYEQLANDKPVALRRPEISYRQYIQETGPLSFEDATALSGLNAIPHSRRSATIALGADLVRRFTPKLQRQSSLTLAEFILGGLAIAFGEADANRRFELEVWTDVRRDRPDLQFTVGPLHAARRMVLDCRNESSPLAIARRAKNRLRGGAIRSAGNGGTGVLLNLECLTDEPWMGGDEWRPQGFIPNPVGAGRTPVEVIPFLDQGGVSLRFDYAEEAVSLAESWIAALENRPLGVWDRLLTGITASDQRAAKEE